MERRQNWIRRVTPRLREVLPIGDACRYPGLYLGRDYREGMTHAKSNVAALAIVSLALVGCAAGSNEFVPGVPQKSDAAPLKLRNVELLAQAAPTMQQFSGASIVCDGKTDNSAAFQGIVNAAGRAGGGIINLPAGVCAVSKTIVVRFSNVMLVGSGMNFPSSAPHRIASSILWIGASGGTLLEYGSTLTPVQAGGFDGINLLSNDGSAAYGVKLNGAEGSTFMNFSADMFSAAAIDLGDTPFDQMHDLFTNYALTNTSNTGAGIVVGTTNHNSAYYNEFDSGVITIKNGTGIEFLQSDGNFFNNTRESMVQDGHGRGVLFGCGSISDHMVGLTPGYSNPHNAVAVIGQSHGCRWPHEAWADSIQHYDAAAGAAVPVVGSGTSFTCTMASNKSCGAQS
jgi:hypothetical protein